MCQPTRGGTPRRDMLRGMTDDDGRRRGAGDGRGASDDHRRGFDPRNLVWALVLAAACAALVRVFFFTHG
jgi:hypothetical protein